MDVISMKTDLVFFEPRLMERLWGGDYLPELYGRLRPEYPIGEAWLVSGLKDKSSVVSGGPFAGMNMDDLYRDHRDLFQNITDPELPILIKMIDAKTKLSVQVHPDDAYAKANENASGKTECWYVTQAEADSFLIVGHSALTKEELIDKLDQGDYDSLLVKVSICEGDFVYIPSGMLHAIGDGVRLVEVQQPSDVTYRVYDYNRRDSRGELRELHLAKAIDVIKVPSPRVAIKNYLDVSGIVELVDAPYFHVEKWSVDQSLTMPCRQKPAFCVVLSGEGSVNDHLLEAGTAFMITSYAEEVRFVGSLNLLVTTLPRQGRR